MSDELNVWREACFAYGGASIEGAELEPSAAAVIRDYGDKRYQQAIADVVSMIGEQFDAPHIAAQALLNTQSTKPCANTRKPAMQVEQIDREAAVEYWNGLADEWNSWTEISGQEQDATVQAFARHRIAAEQRGKLEGARLALEAVLPEVVTDWTIDAHGAHCRCTTCELNIAEDSIRALDPAKIVGEG